MINNVTLVGRLTKDPDLRYSPSGKGVATFTLAVNRKFTNQAGEREADFIQCVIWNKPAETLANYAKKGTLIGVSGRIQTRNYENQSGNRVYVTEIIVENFSFLESRAKNEQRQSSTSSQQSNRQTYNESVSSGVLTDSNMPTGSNIDISDDDLPF